MDKNKDKVKLNDELLDMVSGGGGVDYCPSFVWRTGKLVSPAGTI